jgi:signal transduction histidine kinase/ActR/RegA family two-component response regulator
MSTRLKVFLIITIIILAITASSELISISSAQSQILQTLKDNMQSLVSLANENISNEMESLKSDAVAVAQTLIGHPVYEMQQLLDVQIAAYPNFEAVSLINERGNTLVSYSVGSAPPPDNDFMVKYREKALAGQRVITTTFKDADGKLVFYVFVPMDESGYMRSSGEMSDNPAILGATVSGLYFNAIVNRLMMWNSGRITIVDDKGKIIADIHDKWVEEQLNFLDLAEDDSRYSKYAEVIERMISKGNDNIGTARYRLKGMGENLDNVTAFMPIASPERWAISVSTAIADSAYYTVMGMIGVSGLIFLVLGMVAAAVASGYIAKPFELLKEATKVKTAFIANMSHDLRTPLNAIVSLSQLSRTTKELPEAIREHQKKIYESGMKILGVVNDLLDISNIEAGKFGVISADYNLPEFIMATANSNIRHIGARQLAFTIIPDDKLPVELIGDSLRIRQIFNNLLRHAISHSKTGTIEWRIWTEKGEGDAVWLVSSILDPGQEIGYDEVDKLFLDYSSLDTQKKRSSEGTGLGLSLTKKIVDIMKGSITVQNSLGKGTLFTVRLLHKYVNNEVISAEFLNKLKRFEPSEDKKQNALTGITRAHLPDAHVLVVDDVAINLEVARGMLEPYGMKVDCVLSGKEAIELVRKGEPRYTAILMNRWMPEMDGIEAVRIIRNEIDGDYAKTVPIIALTANAVSGNNAFFLQSGFQAVLSKPMGIHRLNDVVNQWIKK